MLRPGISGVFRSLGPTYGLRLLQDSTRSRMRFFASLFVARFADLRSARDDGPFSALLTECCACEGGGDAVG